MPTATLQTGGADFALSLHALPAAITAFVMVRGVAQFLTVPHAPRPQPYREALRIWEGVELPNDTSQNSQEDDEGVAFMSCWA